MTWQVGDRARITRGMNAGCEGEVREVDQADERCRVFLDKDKDRRNGEVRWPCFDALEKVEPCPTKALTPLTRESGSLRWTDMRCPDCGEMMTNHVIVTRHEKGPCEESFVGPPLPPELEGAIIETERSAALDAFQKIAKLVEHDSPIYLLAAEQASALVAFGRRERSDYALPEGEKGTIAWVNRYMANHKYASTSFEAVLRETAFTAFRAGRSHEATQRAETAEVGPTMNTKERGSP